MTVWITGASSGLGLHTLNALQAAGHTVIAGARSFDHDVVDGVYRLALDVTDESSIETFCREALEISPRVDAVVHCAGVLVLGSCEEVPAEEYRRIMETNFLGMVRMNQRVLPQMRKAGSGRIIMYSSINGLLGIPFQSAYVASKHAVEGYAECLQMETKPFGIQVCVVEPGDHRGGSGKYRACLHPVDSPYSAMLRRGVSVIRHDEMNGCDPARLGKKVAGLLERRRMPMRFRVASADQHLAVWLHKLLPFSFNSFILRGYYLRDGKN